MLVLSRRMREKVYIKSLIGGLIVIEVLALTSNQYGKERVRLSIVHSKSSAINKMHTNKISKKMASRDDGLKKFLTKNTFKNKEVMI